MKDKDQKQQWEFKLNNMKLGDRLFIDAYDEEGQEAEEILVIRVPGGWLFSVCVLQENPNTEEETVTTTTTFVPKQSGFTTPN